MVALCLLCMAHSGQVLDLPPTDDLAAGFSRKFLAFVKADARKAGSVRRLPAAFFYGKARRLLTVPQGRWEQAHVGVCASMLNLLDPDSGKLLELIRTQHPNRETYQVPADERVDFDERFSDVLGFEDSESSAVDKWTSSAGFALGEFAAALVTWHYLGVEKPGQSQFHSAMDALAERARNAPAGVDPNLVKSMTLLGRTAKRDSYSLEELAMMGKRIEISLSTVLPK